MDHFKGLKVVELASVLAGPAVGMFFAELGADVLKIENAVLGGDVTRGWKLSTEKEESVSAYFSAVNYHKSIVFKDLNNKVDNQWVKDQLVQADLVITNFKPGSAEKLGMDFESLKKINPELIYGEITGFSGGVKRPAFDVVLQAETGFMSMNGTLESGPVKMPVALIDVLAAHQLKEGLLLALLKQKEEPKARKVSVSLYDAAISALANQATNWLMNQHVPTRMGSKHPNIAPYGDVFTCKDGEDIVLAVGNNKHFQQLCDILGITKLPEDSRFKNNESRVANRTPLCNELAKAFQLQTADKLMKSFLDLAVPAGKIKNMKEVFEQQAAQQLILTEEMEGRLTKRVKTAVFNESF